MENKILPTPDILDYEDEFLYPHSPPRSVLLSTISVPESETIPICKCGRTQLTEMVINSKNERNIITQEVQALLDEVNETINQCMYPKHQNARVAEFAPSVNDTLLTLPVLERISNIVSNRIINMVTATGLPIHLSYYEPNTLYNQDCNLDSIDPRNMAYMLYTTKLDKN